MGDQIQQVFVTADDGVCLPGDSERKKGVIVRIPGDAIRRSGILVPERQCHPFGQEQVPGLRLADPRAAG